MPIFKNHRGQFHKMITALVALTSLYVIGAAVALSSPYWASSVPTLAPLAAFAATSLGTGILATIAIALVYLAVYSIIKNNKVSEVKAPKIVNEKGQPVLLLTREVLEEMKENNKHEDKNGKVTEGDYCIYFTNSEGKECRVIIDSSNLIGQVGNTLFLNIDSLEMKNDKGEYNLISDEGKQLGLNQNGAKEFNTLIL